MGRPDAKLLDETRITISDCRQAGHCARGAVRWFRDQGYDLKQVMSEGVSAAELWDSGNGLARQVVQRTLERKYGQK